MYNVENTVNNYVMSLCILNNISKLDLLIREGNGNPLQYSCLNIPWTEEPGRLQSMGWLRVGHDWATSLSLFTLMHWRRKWQPTPVFLPGESHGGRSLVGYSPQDRKELDTAELLHFLVYLKLIQCCMPIISQYNWMKKSIFFTWITVNVDHILNSLLL